MSFQSIDKLLQKILNQPQWEKQKRYHQFVKAWFALVNQSVAENTKPIGLKDNTLLVATSSAVYAQNLTLQRYTLLKKINRRLDECLDDIRFTTIQWYQKAPSEPEADTNPNHPSLISPVSLASDIPVSDNAQEALKHWLNNIKTQAPLLSECPCCHAPTPAGEIGRWGVCAICYSGKQ